MLYIDRTVKHAWIFSSTSRSKTILVLCLLPLISILHHRISLYNAEFVHTLAEVFSIFVAFGIFIVAWNTQKFLDDNPLLLLGVSYLFVGAIDFLHTFTFEGKVSNLSAQFWLSARYIESVSLLIAPLSIKWKKFNGKSLMFFYMLVTALLLLSITVLKNFPVCILPSAGLTLFKKLSEIFISFLLIISVIFMIKNRHYFEKNFLTNLIYSAIATILSELSLIFYTHANDFMFTFGHFLKIISFYLIYKSAIQMGMKRPFLYLKQSQSELVSEKEKLLITLQSIGEAVVVTNAKGLIILANKASKELTGWGEEILNESFTKIFYLIDDQTSEPIKSPIKKVIDSGKTVELPPNTILVSKAGMERFISGISSPVRNIHGEIIGAVMVFRDVTLHRRMEEELIKKEKLETIEILSGGIAHDFNNMLAGMMANVELIQLLMKKGEDVTKNLSEIKNAIEKASNLTRQLMTFSKEGAPVKKTSSLKDLIHTTVEFTLHGSSTYYKIIIAEDLWPCKVDKSQISQVIGNLIINAAQSMPEGGTVTVKAENKTLDSEDILPLIKGDYINISIIDEGVGIPKNVIKKIFDPYFTTKKNGNGLGLATSYSIILKHDGYIDVKSKVGRGTTFSIYLPRSTEEYHEEDTPLSQTLTGNGKILIMDDDDVIRSVTGEMLGLIGYEVDFAKNGTEAINRYKAALEEGKPFDVVIMDLTIPGDIGGKEALKSLMKIDSSVTAILSSGYSNHPIIAEYKDHGFSGVLIKPFRVEDLNELVAQIISKKNLTIAG